MLKAALCVLALAASVSSAAARPRTFLASIADVSLGPNEYVDAFSIDTWGVTILAACRIPPGWTLTAGSGADPSGKIAGEASLGVTFLSRPYLRYLDAIVLLRLDGPVRKQALHLKDREYPATFEGSADIGTYGLDERTRKQPLTFRNVRLTPAVRCPPPRR